MSYPDLMRKRLFEPLGMTETAIEVDGALVEGGTTQTGLPAQPWVMDAYAPGMAALEPTTATDQSNTRIGDFWWVSTWENGQTITSHAGQTGGYASYLGVDRDRHKAVIVLSDVANNANDLGIELLIDHE